MGRGRRANGRYQLGQYWLWYRADRDDWCICWLDGRTTRRKSLGVGGGSRDDPPEEAQQALADHFSRNERTTAYHASPDQVLIEDITRQWLTGHVEHLKDAARYANSILVWERFYEHQRRVGKMPDPYTVASVRTAFIRDFIAFREAEGMSAATISRDIAALRGPINWALEEHIINAAPRIIDVEGRSQRRELEYNREQVAALLDAAARVPDRRHLLLYMMIALSAVGRSEAILELDADSQIKGNLIFFNAPGRKQTPKHRAIVPIAPTLRPWLEGLKGRVIQYKASYGEKKRAEGAPEFFTRNVADIGRAFEACLIDAGAGRPDLGLCEHVKDNDGELIWLPPRKKLREVEARPLLKGIGTPNTLRHTTHTYLASKGVPKAQIDTAFGHSTDTGSGDKYNHLRPEYLREFVSAIEMFWAEVDQFTDVHRKCAKKVSS